MGSEVNQTAPWHTMAVEAVLDSLDSRADLGLDGGEAASRLNVHGPNEMIHESGRSWWQLLWAQFTNILVAILVVAAGISFALGDAKDAIAILVIVILNGILGFRQEYSAEKAMAALNKLSVPKCRVRRGGEVVEIEARNIVPGDIVLLEAGNVVPADGRLVECASLRVQESALTGESEAVGKTVDVVAGEDVAVADRRNAVHMGTVVTYGRGEAAVTGTGMNTELGRVASLLSTTEDEVSPLSRKIAHVGRLLIAIAVGLIAIIALIGLVRGDDWTLVFMTAVSMAVAAVPEGLPAVVTIALALGARRMFARRALIRSLPAVETLGAVTAICTDKTGTLTRNVMTVTIVDLPGSNTALEHWDIGADAGAEPGTGSPLERNPGTEIPSREGNCRFPSSAGSGVGLHDNARLLLAAAALCNDAVLEREKSEGRFKAIGDPTEGSLVVAAAGAGLDKKVLEDLLPRIGEAPFDSDRKRMATLHSLDGKTSGNAADPVIRTIQAAESNARAAVFAKGAIGSMVDVSSGILVDGKVEKMTDEWRGVLDSRMEELAGHGIRVLAVAFRPVAGIPTAQRPEDLEKELVFLGLVGMMDPLREEVKDAVATCMEAGIRPVMITGDHPAMARHIAHELGMTTEAAVLTGKEVESMDDKALADAVRESSVYARVSPEHKLRIIDALQANGEIVSMTGDGVNDAPALKSADIGVAMGVTGTDVAKGASDMVLLDDSYTTIVAAVQEGRVIFDNIRRFIRFILASNTGELLTMLLAPFLGMPLPLLPVQILWMNLVTDGLPALALGIEKAESNVMKRPPRDPGSPIVDRSMARQVLWIGLLMAICSLGIGYNAWHGTDLEIAPAAAVVDGHGGAHAASTWQTMLFTTMVFAQLFLSLAMRSTKNSLFKIGILSNRPLIYALLLTAILQLAVIYTPFAQPFFATTALTAAQLGVSVAAAAAIFVAVEVEKWVRRMRNHESRT